MQLEATLERTHRRCATPGCSHNALFLPLVVVQTKTRNDPVSLESSLQFCQKCRDCISEPKQFGPDWKRVCKNAVKYFKMAQPQFNTVRIHWLPLIIDEEPPRVPRRVQSQRYHD